MYVSMNDLGQQAQPGTPENLMTRPEYDRLREIEAAGVPHGQAKQMIFDARKTGRLPDVPQTSIIQRLSSAPLVFAGVATATGLTLGIGVMWFMNRQPKKAGKSDGDKALLAALGIPDPATVDAMEAGMEKTGVLSMNPKSKTKRRN